MSGLAAGLAPPSTPFFTEVIRNIFLGGILRGSVPAVNAGYQVLTMQEFLDKMYNPTISMPLDPRTPRPQTTIQLHIQETKNRIIRELAKDVCRGIGVEYGRIAVERAILGGFYDLCVVTTSVIDDDVVQNASSQGSSLGSSLGSFHDSEVNGLASDVAEPVRGRIQGSQDTEMTDGSQPPSQTSVNSGDFGSQQSHQPGFYPSPSIAPTLQDEYQYVIQEKFKSVMGFIIAQYGECGDHPDEYAINLICTKLGAETGTAALLFGMYLQSILDRSEKTRIPQTGLLELANGYYNTKGCCLYSKFGFVPDENLISDSCFSDPTNMPMSLDFSKMYINLNGSTKSIDEMKQIVCDIVSGTHKGFKLPICNIRELDQRALVLLKEYKRLAYYLQNKRINENDLTHICASKQELRFINSQISRQQKRRDSRLIYEIIVPKLIALIEGNSSSQDPIYIEFKKILAMVPEIDYDDYDAVVAAVPLDAYTEYLIDIEFDRLCYASLNILSSAASTYTPSFGGRQNKTAKRNKRNKKTTKRKKRNKNTKKRK
jgi:hypothetical protein